MSIIKYVTLQKIVAHDFRYDPRINDLHHSCFFAFITCRKANESITKCEAELFKMQLAIEFQIKLNLSY